MKELADNTNYDQIKIRIEESHTDEDIALGDMTDKFLDTIWMFYKNVIVVKRK